jgi:hypothetical protein
MIRRPCLTCGQPTASGSRCPTCEADRQRRRNARRPQYRGNWPKVSRAAIVAHVAAHGWVCPGYGVSAHASTDLTADHQHDHSVAVLCRSCNGRRGALDPVFARGRLKASTDGDAGGRTGEGGGTPTSSGPIRTRPIARPGADYSPRGVVA